MKYLKPIQLPCTCTLEVDVTTFRTGDRGVACDRHERSFVISAIVPKEPEHRITSEIAYKKQSQS